MSIRITSATDSTRWDAFLTSQQYRPFLQSWTMGDVYADLGQEPIRLEARGEHGETLGLCFAHVVPARRGRHLSIPYGPIIADPSALMPLLTHLKDIALHKNCSFLRLSPFRPKTTAPALPNARPSPLHLLGEHLWYLPLTTPDPWLPSSIVHLPSPSENLHSQHTNPDALFASFRSTTRNLIRRAVKEGVTIRASIDPLSDLSHFIALHDETRKRHRFTPYSDAFFRAQVKHFAAKDQLTLYLAEYKGQIIASSIHMRFGGETSYHHGASTHKFSKIPASYLLQWTAIQDAIKRNDHIYNFWGIAPQTALKTEHSPFDSAQGKKLNTRHPFAGVTLFKTGFGGAMLELMHCVDIPLSPRYHVTRAFEVVRKWKRGF